uniref:Cytoplasmic tRNA 2-thiolation protein 2 n=1 Tax=Phallusia mammillata TaxID=59560 RepID=A0A6F9DAS9_9ASCI|nr:cytoplasmic tRNA 2-thiolation protein 2-like [Phallusia mammillata]
MCQVQDGEPVLTKTPVKLSNVCAKCEEKAIIVIGTNGTFCRECFLKYFSHKFRASMGKNPVVRHGDQVLLAYSGGINSSALLHLIQEGSSPNAVRKLKFQTGVIFIDERSVVSDNNSDHYVEEIKQILSSCGFPHYIVKLEDVYDFGDIDESFQDCSGDGNSNEEKLSKLLESAKTLSSKMELISRLRTCLLSLKARALRYDHVFLGETCSRIAVNILSNVALGRGVHIPQDSGFSNSNQIGEKGVNILRPLRDISSKEVVVYNMVSKVQTVFIPNLSTAQKPMCSIQRLTEDFMKNLVAGYPATETTVYRTSNKLKANQSKSVDAAGKNKKCLICCGIIDCAIQVDQVSAVADTALSAAVSNGNHERNGDFSNLFENFGDVDFIASAKQLCYACNVMSKELQTSVNNVWPKY